MKKFIHLHVHSEYSLIDGIVRIKPLIKHCQAENITAIAITDHCNLFAAVKLYKAATQAKIKPIFGAELKIAGNELKNSFNAVFLCMNNTGYANLIKIISRGYTEGQGSGEPVIHLDWIVEHNDGLIRTPFLREAFGNTLYTLFEQTKHIFDPLNIFNPGKKVGASWDYAMSHLDTTKTK